ncbi:OsmC family protein [Luteibacter aegosomatis]|uniref:OsmC family protein n=1 Tax=Luteibacter aegosomatis TaxID=2911537 RepID=UPI001FF96E68|nr:OsmC family protein [Luteibacter aegosomatis]UPG85822.1 OsmC family protein [Luteibacter aegosomatis]
MSTPSKPIVVETTGTGTHQVSVAAQGPTFYVDEPVELGGLASGPTPYELLGAALGACTAMTMQMYARRKGLPLDRVQVAVSHSRDARTGRDRFDRSIYIEGALDEAQTARLMEIADRCPVHKTMSAGADITSRQVDGPSHEGNVLPRDSSHALAMAAACDRFDLTG